jgi:hypothetical protein
MAQLCPNHGKQLRVLQSTRHALLGTESIHCLAMGEDQRRIPSGNDTEYRPTWIAENNHVRLVHSK